jgi:four helix bundle protein
LVIGPVCALPARMTPEAMRTRTKKFAVDVLRFAKQVPRDPINDHIVAQLTEAASASAAAYRSACRARSKADFIYKLGNAIEEADESAFWLEVLREGDLMPEALTGPLWDEADQLTRILVRSRETARNNRR